MPAIERFGAERHPGFTRIELIALVDWPAYPR
jgi:hypothetical protein